MPDHWFKKQGETGKVYKFSKELKLPGKLFLTAALFLFFSVPLFSQNLKEHLDTYIKEYKKIKKVPSISAGVLLKGKIFWTGATGYSDIENLILASPKTIYRIASISKPVTAVAVMQLVEKGKIKLDDDALKYIPYFPKKKWKFSIRQLLNHTSGIRNYKTSEEFNSKEHYKSIKDAIVVMMNDPLVFQPGTKFLYTTLGYNLLAAAVEKASGLSFNNYLKKFVFAPAGMTSTFTEVQTEIIHHRAHGYIKDGYRELQNAPLADLSIKYAGGGLISTSEDLLKFAHALITGKLIKPATLDTMLFPSKLSSGNTLHYGLGLSTDKINGDFFFSHEGNGTGFSSFFVVFPKFESAAVTLINVKDRDLDDPALQLALLALKKSYKLPLTSLPDTLLTLTLKGSIDSALAYYHKIKDDSLNLSKINKDQLLMFGSDLLNINKRPEAIKFYRAVLKDYPSDPRASLFLANAYYSDGNKGLALKNFRNTLKIDPKNSFAKRMVDKLQNE